MAHRTILLINPAAGPLQQIAHNLKQSGCHVLRAENARQGLQAAMEALPEVVVISPQLEEAEIVDLCRSMLRTFQGNQLPAIVLAPAARESAEQELSQDSRLAETLALDAIAQGVRTLSKRAKQISDSDSILECHSVRLDPMQKTVAASGQRIELTPTEFRILHALLARPGQVLSRADLALAADPDKQEQNETDSTDSAARNRRSDVHIKSIRKKLGSQGAFIETVRGMGYRFREEAWNLSHYQK